MPWYLGVLLTVGAPLLFINIYAAWKLTTALSARYGLRKRRTGIVLGCALSILNALPIVAFATFALGGRPAMAVFAGESRLFDILLVYPFWVTLVVMVQLSVVYLLWDIVRGIAVKFLRRGSERWDARNLTVTLWAAAIIILYSLPTLYIQTFVPRVHEVRIPLPAEFAPLDGLRIVHISDVQGDGRTNRQRVAEFVELANTLDADLVMNSGDIVTTGDAYIDQTAEELGNMEASIGRFAAVGDHDIFSGNKQKIIQAVRAAGRHIMLEDTSISFMHNNVTIGLSFITYTYRQRPSEGAIDTVLSMPDSVYKILLVHQPSMPLMEKAIMKGYDLVLAGHTHGGGVAFGVPGLALLAPASFETRYVAGVYQEGKTFINVTTGLGFTLAPVRFHAPIEISLLILDAPKR